jgi:hypothetical protein
MQYLLVLQFPEKLIDFNRLVEIEDDLAEMLKDSEIDGHDIGLGEVNFFILTNKPKDEFKRLKQYLIGKELFNSMKAAYRRTDGEEYVILCPDTLTKFKVK